jgi:hypothetical protein
LRLAGYFQPFGAAFGTIFANGTLAEGQRAPKMREMLSVVRTLFYTVHSVLRLTLHISQVYGY